MVYLHWIWKGKVYISKICLCLFVIIMALYESQSIEFQWKKLFL